MPDPSAPFVRIEECTRHVAGRVGLMDRNNKPRHSVCVWKDPLLASHIIPNPGHRPGLLFHGLPKRPSALSASTAAIDECAGECQRAVLAQKLARRQLGRVGAEKSSLSGSTLIGMVQTGNFREGNAIGGGGKLYGTSGDHGAVMTSVMPIARTDHSICLGSCSRRRYHPTPTIAMPDFFSSSTRW
jgi:hypothetical protein